MRRFLLSVLLPGILCLFPRLAFSQAKIKVSGTVSDGARPLPFVTIRLFKNNEANPLQTTLSRESGVFQLK